MDKPEIVVYKNETRVVRGLGQGVLVAVEGHEVSFWGEAGEDLAAVAAAAEGRVGVEAVGVEDQRVNAGMQQDWIVVLRHLRAPFSRGFPQWQ